MINGSPHPRGCTYMALHEMEQVLQAAGAETQILTVGAEQVGGCAACGGCNATGRCVRGGLVNDAIDAMETADALVLASPVHYAGTSGAMSAFCDRLFYAGGSWANKPCACVVSARRAGTTAALDQLVKYPMISNMPVVSSQYWPMVHGARPEDVAQDEEGLQTMRQLARNLLWLLQCIAAGDAAGVPRPETEARKFTNFIRRSAAGSQKEPPQAVPVGALLLVMCGAFSRAFSRGACRSCARQSGTGRSSRE